MHQLVSPFIVTQYQNGNRQGDLTAASLFVDISGFSTLMNTLMEHGQHGAELMAHIMRQIFTPLVETIYAHDGFITVFAGDAFTALFPYTHNERLAMEQALAAGWSILTNILQNSSYKTPYGSFTIGVKVGAASGACHWRIIEAEDGERAAFYFRGTAVDAAAQAEKVATKNQMILTPTARQIVADWVTDEPAGDHYRLLTVAEGLPCPKPVNLTPSPLEVIRHFFPHETLLNATQTGEFRHVVNLFISLQEPLTDKQITLFARTIMRLQTDYGGLLNRIDFGDKGCTALIFWGAPVAYENDIQRALSFILELQHHFPTSLRAGITQGIAHCGLIGSDIQGEYTCNGNGVTLAARLVMHADWGQLLALKAVATAPNFKVVPIGDVTYKGFNQPLTTYELLGEDVGEDIFHQKLVGRDIELNQLAAFVQPWLVGESGGVAIINGEAGMGKSHLLYAFHDALEDKGKLLTGYSNAILQQPFDPFVYFLKRYFRQTPNASELENKEKFKQQLADLMLALPDIPDSQETVAELQRASSFLGALLGLHWADSPYEQLDAEGRYQNTVSGIKVLLQAECQCQPVLLILEDGHWFDEVSTGLLLTLSEETAVYPLLIFITSRYQDDGSRFSYPCAPQTAVLQLNLKTLSPTALHLLAEDLLGDPITEQLHQLLIAKSQANPFFAQQILLYLRENNLLSPLKTGDQQKITVAADNALDLPVTLNTLLIARLDRLPSTVKRVVQTAAVLGREFESRLLTNMLMRDLTADLNHGEREQVWTLLETLSYIFNHVLMRDAAYDMQLRTHLQELHRTAAQAYETLYQGELPPYYADLAYHYGQAGMVQQEFHYCVAAGEQVAEQFASQEAIKYFSRALALAPQLSIPNEVRQKIYLQRGRVWELLMEYEKAYASYLEMADWAEQEGDQSLSMAALLAQTIPYITFSPYFNPQKGQQLADKAMILARELDDKASEAKILWGLMLTYGLGTLEFPISIRYGRQALIFARQLDSLEQLAITLNDLGRILGFSGRLTEGCPMMLEARPLLQQVDNKSSLVDNYHGYALLALFAGDFAEARDSAQQAIQLADEIHDDNGQINAMWYLATCQTEQGEWNQALASFESVFQSKVAHPMLRVAWSICLCQTYIAIGLTDDITMSLFIGLVEDALQSGALFKNWFVGQLARVHIAQGDLTAAAKALDLCAFDVDTTPFSSIGSLLFVADVELTFAQGDMGKAQQKATRLIERFEKAGQGWWLLDLLLTKAKTEKALGQPQASNATLVHALEIAEPTEKRVRWQLLAMLADLAQAEGKIEEARKWHAQAQQLITYLLFHLESSIHKNVFERKINALYPDNYKFDLADGRLQ